MYVIYISWGQLVEEIKLFYVCPQSEPRLFNELVQFVKDME